MNKALPTKVVQFCSYNAVTCYIVDTGAGIHLQRKRRHLLMKRSNPLRLTTASGTITSNHITVKHVEMLGNLDFRVLDDTPNLLSVGRLIRECGLTFVWGPGKPPMFRLPNVDAVLLEVIDDVPTLREDKINILKALVQ